MKRFNISQAKEVPGRDKPVWIRVGVAFDKEDGKPPRMKLEALPIPNKDGEIWLSLFEDDRPAQNDQNQGAPIYPGNPSNGSNAISAPQSGDFADDIPF